MLLALMLFLGILLSPYVIITLIVLVFGKKQNLKKDYSYRPTVTVFLPTFNEEKYISEKLENLSGQTYPIEEILIYDCSTDQTKEIIREYQKKFPNVKLIDQERIGMARTLNEALMNSAGDIIVKTDCDSLTKSRDALREIVSDFSDEKVGGACGVCTNKGVEGWFRILMTRLQVAESNIDSTIIAHATSLLAFRRKVVKEVNPVSLADDTEEFVIIRKQGYQTVVDKEVVSEEDIPQTFAARRIQKDRRAQGIISVLLGNLSILFNRKYGLYGLVVFPLEFFLLVISPFIAVFSVILLGFLLFSLNQLYLIPYALLLSSPIVLFRAKKLDGLIAIIDSQLSALLGTLRFLIGKNNPKWERVR